MRSAIDSGLRASVSLFTQRERVWRNGSATASQAVGCGFESRHPLQTTLLRNCSEKLQPPSTSRTRASARPRWTKNCSEKLQSPATAHSSHGRVESRLKSERLVAENPSSFFHSRSPSFGRGQAGTRVDLQRPCGLPHIVRGCCRGQARTLPIFKEPVF